MVFTSDSLPFHHNVNYRRRRVGFEIGESKGFWAKAGEKLLELLHYATRAPTGSPSDGMGGDTESTTSMNAATSAFIATQKMLTAEQDGNDWEVDEIVVSGEDSDHPRRLGMGTISERTTSGSPHHSSHDADSLRREEDNTPGHYSPSAMSVLRSKWQSIHEFFQPEFPDKNNEIEFRKQHWYSTKAWAFYGSLYLVLNWVLYLIFNLGSTKRTIYAQVLFYGGLSLLTIPLPFLIAFDIPLHHRVPFQIWFAAAVWYCGITETIQMHICHFFIRPNHCFGKDFLATLYYTTALPTVMMFVVSERLYNAILQAIEFVLLMALIIPIQGIYARNVVSFVLFSMFLQGLHYNREITERRLYLLNAQLKVAYSAQQKAQMAQTRASHAKRRFASYIFHEVRVPLHNAAIAFNNMTTSEAFQKEVLQQHNLSEDVEALDVSLATVQQVLNDSLDLEKMDAGHFDINPRPFPLHRVIRSTLGPLIISAAAKNLVLHVDLDERIDNLSHITTGPSNEIDSNANTNGHTTFYAPTTGSSAQTSPMQAQGLPVHMQMLNKTASPNSRTHGSGSGSGSSGMFSDLYFSETSRVDLDGTWVVGDEVRLRQILTNLASNAVKFTPEGAEAGVTVRTILVARRMSDSGGRGSDGVAGERAGGGDWSELKGEEAGVEASGSGGDLERGERSEDGVHGDGEKRHRPQPHPHQDHHSGSSQGCLVFRLEVSDSGPGIKPSDLTDHQLFQPFAQTKVGKLNKNSSGLGLAIVRQIVSLSGGRLGVQSQKGRGATFWVELSYPIAHTPDIQTLAKSPLAATLSLSHSPRTATAAATAAANMVFNSSRWPTVAFAEDVKPPMIIGAAAALRMAHTPTPAPILPLSTESTLPPPITYRLGSDAPLLPEPPQVPKAEKPKVEEEAAAATGSGTGEISGTMVDAQASPSFVEDDGPLRVLVVDDNQITRETMSRSLRKRGCIVDTAKDGKECLDMVLGEGAKMYDLISLDNDMPVMTGEEAVREIRQVGRHDIFVVGCTGNALTDDQTTYLDAGADRVLVKPIRFDLWSEVLETAKQKRRQRRGDS